MESEDFFVKRLPVVELWKLNNRKFQNYDMPCIHPMDTMYSLIALTSRTRKEVA